MEKFYHEKLIRDKIPQVIEENDGEYETRKLDEEEFEKELRKKLIEEAEEAKDADDEELLKELSDVLQVIKSIADNKGMDFEEIERKQEQRKKERGGFSKGIFLTWSNQKGDK